jgi:AcrR family transcriptional regulator
LPPVVGFASIERDAMNRAREPKQQRSQATLARFLRAGAELLEETSFDDLTIQQIVDRAGSSIGAFYARFHDKQGLLDALREALERDAAEDPHREFGSKDWTTVPLESAVAEYIRALVHQHRRHRGTLRALVGRSISGKHPAPRPGADGPDRADARRPGGGAHSPLPLLDFIRSRRREIVHPDPDVAAHIGVAMVVSAVRERVLFPELAARARPTASVTDALFAEELARALVRFLGVNAREDSG